jgi:hypothetical protein
MAGPQSVLMALPVCVDYDNELPDTFLSIRSIL